MKTEVSAVMDEAARATQGGMSDQLLERLADKIGARASVKAVFGEPIERGDLTVVPVARVRWGFGGGSGSASEMGGGPASGSGTGGGGGVAADPIGYLEMSTGGATWRPIAPPYPSPLFLIASGLMAAIVIRALARLLRR